MKQEKLFYEELAKAPPLPSDIHNNIQKVSHNNTIKQTLFAFAASIVLIFGSLQIITHQKADNTTIQPEVASEHRPLGITSTVMISIRISICTRLLMVIK